MTLLPPSVANENSNLECNTAFYYTPYNENYIGIYNESRWKCHQFTERSLSLSGLSANTNYDISHSGTPTLNVTGTNEG